METYPNSSRTTVELVEVDDDHAGQRVDNFLAGRLRGVPKSRLYRVLRKGEVRVNGGRTAPDYRLQPGDVVRIPPLWVAAEPPPAPLPGQRVLTDLGRRVLFEDERLLILDKPAGMAVHGGSGISFGVIEALRAQRPDARFLELVHRLDRDTSGCLMVAKKGSSLRALHQMLRQGRVEKRYLALVRGDWQGGARRIEAPLHKNVLQSGERIVRVAESGKPAVSVFQPVTRYAEATLMRLRPLTGRTHQLRVHAQAAGCPIAGDEKYGDAVFNRRMREFGLTRLFLHAEFLRLRLPELEPALTVSAPLPVELQRVLEGLQSR